jgi:hypothetical protein
MTHLISRILFPIDSPNVAPILLYCMVYCGGWQPGMKETKLFFGFGLLRQKQNICLQNFTEKAIFFLSSQKSISKPDLKDPSNLT